MRIRRPSERELFARIRNVLAGGSDRVRKARLVADSIRLAGDYRWVGIYDAGSEEIAALAWSGEGDPAHPRFPSSQGLCGAAVASGKTILVGDVTKDPRYLTTLSTTRSEIILPVFAPGVTRPAGLIDVESALVDGFGEADREMLENCAVAISSLWGP
jgi:L-methionine (R)-S-oxide reductase